MKRKLAVLLLAVLLLTMSIATFCACDNKSPLEVEIEIINPLSGKAFEQDETIELPNEETKIEVRVKDKKKGRYLTEKDFEDKALAECLKISVSRLWKYEYKETLNSEGNLPIEKDGEVTSNYYEIEVTFETKPSNVKEEEYERKYEAKTRTVNFYSNKDWKGTDYFETVLEKSGSLKGEWDSFPELTIMVENTRELNEFINNPNHEAYCDRMREAIQSLVKYDEDYFEEKSLIIIIKKNGDTGINGAGKIVIDNGKLTVNRINTLYIDAIPLLELSETIQVIAIDKKVLEDIQSIQVENISRKSIINIKEKNVG